MKTSMLIQELFVYEQIQKKPFMPVFIISYNYIDYVRVT